MGQRVADPACGTGEFLLGAYQYILTDLERKNASTSYGYNQEKSLSAGNQKPIEKDEDGFERAAISAVLTQDVKGILDKSFTGYDIDIAILGIAYPIIVDKISNIGDKFSSQYIPVEVSPP